MCPPGLLCWGPDGRPALFWGSNQDKGGDSAIPGWEAPTFPFPAPFLSFLSSLNLRFIQTAPSPSGPTQRGAERGSLGWLLKEGSGLASFVCVCVLGAGAQARAGHLEVFFVAIF